MTEPIGALWYIRERFIGPRSRRLLRITALVGVGDRCNVRPVHRARRFAERRQNLPDVRVFVARDAPAVPPVRKHRKRFCREPDGGDSNEGDDEDVHGLAPVIARPEIANLIIMRCDRWRD